MNYNARRHAIMVHYQQKLEKIAELDAAIMKLQEEKQKIHEHLSHPPKDVLALFNDDDRYIIQVGIEGFFYGDRPRRNNYFLEEVNDMVHREEVLASEKVQDARLGFELDTGPFIPKYLSSKYNRRRSSQRPR